MNIFRRIAQILNVQSGEERLIGSLVLLYFTLALSFVFVQSMAFGLFITEYGPQGLPYSYISIALFASLVAVLYIRLGERVSFSTLLTINLITLGVASIALWLGLVSPLFHSVAFLLPLWFQILVNQGNLVVWPLAGRLFNFRQGKRLFPLLGAGTWLGNIVGGLLVPTLVKTIGVINLLLLAAASVGLSLLVLRYVTRTYLGSEAKPVQARRSTKSDKKTGGIFKERYILLIVAYTVLWWVSFFFVDNIFYDRTAAQFPDAGQLTIFTGQLLSIMGFVALFSSTILSSRIINRFGLRAGLAGMPFFVTLAVALVAFGESLGAPLILIFWLAAGAKLINVAFGFSLSQSANAIVYQSLPDTIRGRVQATTEGIFQPIAIGLAGLILLALTAGLKFDYRGLSTVFIGLGAAWLIVIGLLSSRYITALTQAITRRRLGESAGVVPDPASIRVLQEHLHSPHPGVAIYALNQLEALDSASARSELPKLTKHAAPEVRREAFTRIGNLNLHSALPAVREQIHQETVPDVKEAALQAMGAIAGSDSLDEILQLLDSSDVHTVRGALTVLLKQGHFPAANQKYDELLHSSSPSDRKLAAQIAGNAPLDSLRTAQADLLQDPDPEVRREAIKSIARNPHPRLYQSLVEACDSPVTRNQAGLALIAIGRDAFPEISAGYTQVDAPIERLLTLAKVLGRIGGTDALGVLRSRLESAPGDLRLHILHGLSVGGYREANHAAVKTTIRNEAEATAWICAALVELGDSEKTYMLRSALNLALQQSRERVILTLSLAYDRNVLMRVRDALTNGSPVQAAFALEIIENQLPLEMRLIVLPLMEDLPPLARLERLKNTSIRVHSKGEDVLRKLIETQPYNAWVRVCALYTAGQLGSHTHRSAVESAATSADPLIRETARWTLDCLSLKSQKGMPDMLSTIEKVLILKSVDMFSRTPDDVLVDVADLLEQVDAAEGEKVFSQGDYGDGMYIIIDGKVRVDDGERLLNYLGERQVFGEMALLDPEPRLASVTAVEPTRMFRLEQAPFYELISERPEIATGIIHVLTQHLRNRVRDIAQLDTHIRALESSQPAR